jgi:PTS system nitrogen regulatory IIA component
VNRLSAILTPADVAVDIEATGKPGLFEQAGRLFETHHSIAMSTVAANLLARERLGSTGLGHGVAIPHGRIKGLKSPVAAVLRLRRPIAFDAPDDEPVVLLVFLFVPEAATQRHLEILAEIAEMLADPGLRERLKNESDAGAMYRTIAAWEAPGASAARPSSS